MRTRKVCWIVALVAVVIGTSIAFSAPRRSNRRNWRETAAKALDQAIKEGKSLFHDKTLSTNGKYCAKCHENPKKPKLRLQNRVNDYPKWDRHAKKVITLGQKINQMFVRMLKTKPQELGSEKLVAIQAYLMSISRDRKNTK